MAKKQDKKSFVMYDSWAELFLDQDPEVAGLLIQAIYKYRLDKDYMPDKSAVRPIFKMILSQFEEDEDKYARKCEANRQAVESRWNKDDTNVYERTDSNTNYTDKDKDKDKDRDKDNDRDYEKDNESLTGHKNICSEQAAEQTVVPDCEALILNDGSDWWPTVDKYSELQRLYPNADVQKEFAKMRAWCIGNPNKRKTKAGAMRFVTNWLNKAQDGGRSPTKPPDKFAMMEAWARGEYDKGGIFNTG